MPGRNCPLERLPLTKRSSPLPQASALHEGRVLVSLHPGTGITETSRDREEQERRSRATSISHRVELTAGPVAALLRTTVSFATEDCKSPRGHGRPSKTVSPCPPSRTQGAAPQGLQQLSPLAKPVASKATVDTQLRRPGPAAAPATSGRAPCYRPAVKPSTDKAGSQDQSQGSCHSGPVVSPVFM